jgi:hypothetical protein
MVLKGSNNLARVIEENLVLSLKWPILSYLSQLLLANLYFSLFFLILTLNHSLLLLRSEEVLFILT